MSEEKKEEAVIIHSYTVRCKQCGWTTTFFREEDNPPEQMFCHYCHEIKIVKLKEKS